VENGLFLDICDVAIIGNSDGTVELRDIHDGSIEHERVDLVDGDNLFVDVVD
jgi:ribose 5-phosphate isomerase A